MQTSIEIEKKAGWLLARAVVHIPPVPVKRVAEHIGIKIELADLGEDCSAVLVRNGPRAVIGINKTEPITRRRFSIAHEIGHFLLHKGETYIDKGYRVNFRDLESGSGTKKEEMDANAFAAALLMPAPWVRAAFKKQPFDLTDDESLGKLAHKFKVSTLAMTYRLMKLRII